ncbi:MAG: helix-turn-helix domain-containing protein [Streptosporangiales bacterium]|nr:helix-turn-helix domain-containing protein [Streptosporangiales bacterium]
MRPWSHRRSPLSTPHGSTASCTASSSRTDGPPPVPSSSSSSAQAARQALVVQLREVRERAGLTARALAAEAGWRPQKISRVEHGVRPISAVDLSTWCQICGVSPERTEELLAERSTAAGMWTTMQRLHRAGLKQAQESVRSEFEQVRLYRCYQPMVVPGLLQIANYTATALESVNDLLGLSGDDVAEAVVERMDRQHVLHRPDARWLFVVEEQVLHHRVCVPDVHRAQLKHLRAVMSYPSVSLGIIPSDVDRPLRWPCEGFAMMEGPGWRKVNVELVSGYLQITTPSELALYRDEFDALAATAVHGAAARALIASAAESLAP